jgi:hypothetical protein
VGYYDGLVDGKSDGSKVGKMKDPHGIRRRLREGVKMLFGGILDVALRTARRFYTSSNRLGTFDMSVGITDDELVTLLKDGCWDEKASWMVPMMGRLLGPS